MKRALQRKRLPTPFRCGPAVLRSVSPPLFGAARFVAAASWPVKTRKQVGRQPLGQRQEPALLLARFSPLDQQLVLPVFGWELNRLDAWIREQAVRVPESRRVLVTTHDTFGYFADRYGFEALSVMGSVSSEVADPSAAEVAAVVQQIRTRQVPAVFAENILSPRLTEQIVREAGVLLVRSLYTDALGAADSPGSSYLSMMRFNVQTIVEALR